ncbi:protein kinase family protein [Streptomyces glaucosporus]|uniref:Protein kinase family protein n=1 Tax=Streptomyces glaucosporus TaxID=284044 RepID=A0ABP5UQE6_9ACTN
MAERSTAAVDVAGKNGGAGGKDKPSAAEAEQATSDGATAHDSDDNDPAEDTPGADTEGSPAQPVDSAPPKSPSRPPQPPELHSGHKLARRYRLEECVTRLDGFSSWRAVDEKLRRAVGVHLLAADHPRARSVLAAARSAALLGDPRFVQVLDAVEENDLVYVVHEWLPDATSLTTLLAAGPLQTHEAYQLVSQVTQAMTAAHREGLAHLRLTPGCVLRTAAGQYRIRGLAVNAALRGISSDHPQRTDTEAIGALLYAALTQRWPYREDAYGLSGMAELTGDSLVPPDQVRAGVHRGLSELAMRALVNNGATASRQEKPCTTPEELSKAISALPRIRPPEPEFTAPPPYQHSPLRNGAPTVRTPMGPVGPPAAVPAAPPALPGRTGRFLKWSVSALLIAALGLGSWQLADVLMRGKVEQPSGSDVGQNSGKTDAEAPKAGDLDIKEAREYYPDGRPQNADEVSLTHDGDPGTYWRSKSFRDGPVLKPYKAGVGIVYDLGAEKKISSATISLQYGGDHTDISLYAADTLSSSASIGEMREIASGSTSSKSLKLTPKKPRSARYLVVWITAAPYAPGDSYSNPGYKQGVNEVLFKGY